MELVLLKFGLLVHHLVFSQISTKPDLFRGDGTFDEIGAKIIQSLVDDNGRKWERTVSPLKLDLLSNDKLMFKDHKTCRQTVKTFVDGTSGGSSAFQEIGAVS